VRVAILFRLAFWSLVGLVIWNCAGTGAAFVPTEEVATLARERPETLGGPETIATPLDTRALTEQAIERLREKAKAKQLEDAALRIDGALAYRCVQVKPNHYACEEISVANPMESGCHPAIFGYDNFLWFCD